MYTNKYLTEIEKLHKGLTERGISHIMHPLWDGYQIVVGSSDLEDRKNTSDSWDAVCHSGSYGHEDNLLEIMGCLVEDDGDDVEGFLTAEDILKRIDRKEE